MKPVKRVEIVIDAVALPRLLEALRAAGATGWTVMRDVAGTGERGERAADEIAGVNQNAYVLVACDAAKLTPIAEGIRPILATFGGVCLVSDAAWLLH